MSAFGGDDSSSTLPGALLATLAGSPLTTKGQQGDQLRYRHVIVDTCILSDDLYQ